MDPRREGIIIDDHPLWLEALAQVCRQVGIEVLGLYTSDEEVLDVLEARSPDVLITDLRLPEGHTALGLVREARKRFSGLRIAVVSAFDDPDSVDDALTAGADVFISKAAPADDMASALRQIFHPSLFIGPGYRNSHARVRSRSAPVGLTRREAEILDLVSQGFSNSRVAKMLWVTEQTVKFHLSNIYRKLGVVNRTEATRWALEHANTDRLAAGERR